MSPVPRFAIGAAKTFAIGVAKMAVALLLVLAVVFGVIQSTAERDRRSRAPLATRKDWPPKQILHEMPVVVSTAWRDGRAYYRLSIDGFSADNYRLSGEANLTLRFSDEDGFKLWERAVSFSNMTRIVDASEKQTGFSWAGDEPLLVENYRRAAHLDVPWSGISVSTRSVATAPPLAPERKPPARAVQSPDIDLSGLPDDIPEPTIPGWRSAAAWRLLAIGMKEETVCRLLGDPTQVIQYGHTNATWRYGSLRDGGEVRFTSGLLSGWREPNR